MSRIPAVHLDAGRRPRCGHRFPARISTDLAEVTCGACLQRFAGGNTLGLRHPDWQLAPHGTLAAYRRHYRRGEQPCEPCRQAKSRDNADRAARHSYNAKRRESYRQLRQAGASVREATAGKRIAS